MRVLAAAPAVRPARETKASAPTRRAALGAMFLVPSLTVVARYDAAMAKTDYETDAKAVLDAQRKLLRDGKGDAYGTYRKAADEFFTTYKFDHKGHTNSFSQTTNLDVIVETQREYLDAKGLKWDKTQVPPSSSNKGAMLDAYLANGERCLVKEAYPPFGEIRKDESMLAEWKAIECTQGLVKPK
jgi:hypothetical protein